MRLRILPVMLGALLLIGAGCIKQPSTTNNPEVKGDTDKNATDNSGNEEMKSELTLTGSNTGPNSVKLEWSATNNVAESTDKWMIIENNEANPAYPGNYRYYFVRDVSYHDRVWNNLPKGTSHFRVCAFINGACTTYSNDFAIEIPGRLSGGK